MKTSRRKSGGFVKLASIAGILAPLLLLLTGCETPEQTAMLGGLLAGNAAVASSAQQAASYAAAAQTAGSVAQIQSQQRAAEAGRTQIQINQSPGVTGKTTYVEKDRLDSGSIYTGPIEWFEANRYKPTGRGYMENLKATDGSVYTGFGYANGVQWMKDGQGKFVRPNGTKMEGEFKDDEFVRVEGTDVWPDGTKYTGTWDYKNAEKSGGTISWPDGRVYKGRWRIVEREPDLPEGKGEMTWPDGRKYVGEFKDGKMHGSGKMTYADGKAEDGVWRDGSFVRAQSSSDASGQSGSFKFGFVSVAAADESFEVFADAAFVGNTPAKLKLSEGAHVIEVKKAGFKDYRKEIKVSDGSELNLRAVLEKN